MKKVPAIQKPRNHVALALIKRGWRSIAHHRSEKAKRRLDAVFVKKEAMNLVDNQTRSKRVFLCLTHIRLQFQ